MTIRIMLGAIFSIGLGVGSAAIAQERDSVSRNPPKEWKVFEQILIPFEKAKALPAVPLEVSDEPEVETLVSNSYIRVNEDGSSLSVRHTIRRLLKEAAMEDFSTVKHSYRPEFDKIHVVTARTVLADGQSIPVENAAMFVEQPESNGDILFSDNRTVRIVFPKISPGVYIETVVVEERLPSVPNHWSRGFWWQYPEPVRDLKVVIDVPKEFSQKIIWDRKKVSASPTLETDQEDWDRFTLAESRIPALKFEPGMPSIAQRGPFVRVGFGDHWELFGKWFAGLIEDASSDISGLKTQSEEWVADATTPRAIAAKLFDKVSIDIRYTGLEFGDGAFQPRSPAVVLETQYGDCKDKSNLLRALLQHHNIPSRIVLLQSTLPGEISREIASTSLFDHAILAVDFPDESGPVFCDPTLEGVQFGMVADRDQGKEVLIVGKNGELEWGRTPDEVPTHTNLKTTLDIESTGAYSGWFEISVDGSQGWMLRQHFEKLDDRSARMSFAAKQLFPFVGGLRLVDGQPVEPAAAPFHYRFYAIQNLQSVDQTEKTSRFSLPCPRAIVTPVGRESVRIQPYILPAATVEVESTAKLPEGWELIDQPEDFEAENKGFKFTASWEASSPSTLVGKSSMSRTLREFKPRTFTPLQESTQNLVKWLTSPVLLKRTENNDELTDWSPSPESLLKMPSSEGFTALINERFPFDPRAPFEADHVSRKKAFQRMAKLYPKDDDDGQFTASVMILTCRLFNDASENQARTIAASLQKTLKDYEGKVNPEKIASTELLIAVAISEAGDFETAQKLCEDLFDRTDISETIKMGAATVLAPLIAEEDPEKCAELVTLSMKNSLLPDSELSALASLKLDCMARLSDCTADSLAKEMKSISAQFPGLSEDLNSTYLAGPGQLVSYGYQTKAKMYQDALKLAETDLEINSEEMDDSEEMFETLEKVTPLHDELLTFLESNPWPDLDLIEEGDQIESALDCIDLFVDSNEVCVRYLLRGLTKYGPQPDFADRISEFVETLENWHSEIEDDPKAAPKMPPQSNALNEFLIELWLKSPDGTYSDHTDALLAKGDLILNKNGRESALAHFRKIATDESQENYPRLLAIDKMINIFDAAKNLDGYLSALKMTESFTDEPAWRDAAIIQGAYLNAQMENQSESQRLFKLAATDENEDSEYPGNSKKLAVEITSNFEQADTWRKQSETWWPKWEKLAKNLKIEQSTNESWSDFKPWVSPGKKAVNNLAKQPPKKQKRQLKNLLNQQMTFVRWHEQGTANTVKLLNLAAELFPDQKVEALALAEEIRSKAHDQTGSHRRSDPI